MQSLKLIFSKTARSNFLCFFCWKGMDLKFFMVLVKFLSTKKRKAHVMEKDFYRRVMHNDQEPRKILVLLYQSIEPTNKQRNKQIHWMINSIDRLKIFNHETPIQFTVLHCGEYPDCYPCTHSHEDSLRGIPLPSPPPRSDGN